MRNKKRVGVLPDLKKLMIFFDNGLSPKVSHDSEELIKELKKDIAEFGEDYSCWVFYKETDDSLIFTNYDFITEEEPITEDELEKNEYTMTTNLGDALKLFERQNKIL